MPKTVNRSPIVSSAAILCRIFEGGKTMNLTLAREILKLDFSAEDRARVHELSLKSSSGTISKDEDAEFGYYVDVGDLLACLQSSARMALKASEQKAAARG